jgi:hypothetical protein
MAQTEAPTPLRSDRWQVLEPSVLAATAEAIFAACLLIAVRYPNVPRIERIGWSMTTNLFVRRVSIAAVGSVVVLVVGTFVILRMPTPRSTRFLELGVPMAALAAAIVMPVVTICPPPGIGQNGYCTGYFFKHIVEGTPSAEIPARLLIGALGCLGGLYFWILDKRSAQHPRGA